MAGTGSLLIFAVALLFARWLGADSALQQLGVGCLWIALTILFEVGVGRLALGLPWKRIIEDYDLARGGLLDFGLLFMGITPWLAARLRAVAPATTKGRPWDRGRPPGVGG